MANARPTNPLNEDRQHTEEPHGVPQVARPEPEPADRDGKLGRIKQQLDEAEARRAEADQELDTAAMELADGGNRDHDSRSKQLHEELGTLDRRIQDLHRALAGERARLKKAAQQDLKQAQEEHQQALEQLHQKVAKDAEKVDQFLDALDEQVQRYRTRRAHLQAAIGNTRMGMFVASNDRALEQVVGIRLGYAGRPGEYAFPGRDRFVAHMVRLGEVQHRGHWDSPVSQYNAEEYRADAERLRKAAKG